MDSSRVARAAVDLAHEAARGAPVLLDVLRLVDRAVGADVTNSSVALDLGGRTAPEITVLNAPPLGEAEHREWLRLIPTHPFARSLATGPPRTARLTDVMSLRELEPLEVYQCLLRPRGSTYQVAAVLDVGPASFTLVSVWRAERDFTDAEVALVETVRRPLAAAMAFRAAVDETCPALAPTTGWRLLTPRQREVCSLLALGLTNAQIASRTAVSERTVRKHVGDVFERTGCTNRTAVAVWWRSQASGVALG